MTRHTSPKVRNGLNDGEAGPPPGNPVDDIAAHDHARGQVTEAHGGEASPRDDSYDVPVRRESADDASGDPVRIREFGWNKTTMQIMDAQLRSFRDGTADQWTMDDFVYYLTFYKRRAKRTVANYRSQLGLMARHPVVPVELHGSRADIISNFSMYVNYREHEEHTEAGALATDHKAIRALGAFLSIPDNVWPGMPKAVSTESRWVPDPEQVNEILQADHGPRRSYECHLARYMLAYSFGIGVRPPSELHSAKVDDVDLKHGVLIIEETKKAGTRRELVVSPDWLISGRTRLSLKNWIEGPRNLCEPRTNALFPNVDGQPFRTREAMRNFLVRQVRGDPRDKAVPLKFDWYQPYVARHWSVNARLIESARVVQGQTIYDWNAVARWHGHESVKMTMSTYGRAVEVNHRKYGAEWLSRAFGTTRAARSSTNRGSRGSAHGARKGVRA